MYQRIEGRMWRHVWVVSDIHGCYQRLLDELKCRHFNPFEDLLISVGDLIDRGPDSVKSLQLINEKWFRAVRGNGNGAFYPKGGVDMHHDNHN